MTTLTGDTITTATIRTFRDAAGAAGDLEAVAICERALDKSIPTSEMMSARQSVADMVTEARANDDG